MLSKTAELGLQSPVLEIVSVMSEKPPLISDPVILLVPRLLHLAQYDFWALCLPPVWAQDI